MVRVFKNNSGKVLLAGVFGIVAILSITILTFIISNKPVHAANLGGCTVSYGNAIKEWDGNGSSGNIWNDPDYTYKAWGFAVIADGQATEKSFIDSDNIDCYGTPDSPSTSTMVDPAQLKSSSGQMPERATLGLPGDITWTSDQIANQIPDHTPPVYRESFGRHAVFVDDGGMALLNNEPMWCVTMQTSAAELQNGLDAPSPPLPPGFDGCGPDINSNTYPNHNGAGYLFIDSNCPPQLGSIPPGVPCTDGNNFNWYRVYNNNSTEWTSRIGLNGNVLKPFRLRMLARQSHKGGLGTIMTMTFRYKKPAAQCISLTAPPAVALGQTFNATVSIRNNGNTTWTRSDPNPYRFGLSDPRDTTKWAPLSPSGGYSNRVLLPSDIAPGQTATQTFSATATQAGSQTLSLEIVQDGVIWVGGKCSTTIQVGTGPGLVHKIYGASIISLSKQLVRDNETFVASLQAYVWPDAGRRSQSFDRSNRLWLAGIWGEQGQGSGASADNAQSDNSNKADPNVMTTFNGKAELNCPGASCLERVPLAYVPAADGQGINSTATQDGSTTPNGNKWQPIRDESYGSYNSLLGGIASTNNSNVGGHTGNYIHNVEISNIRVEAVGPHANATNAAAQGGVTSSTLQPDNTTQSLNLPPNSQGPVQNGLPINGWDNIRKPGAPGGLTIASTQASVDYGGTNTGSPANFTDNPESMLAAFAGTVTNRAKTFSSVNVTSLLQDGQDKDHPSAPYSNLSEPLSYTAGLGSIDNARLKWDEYVDWSQVDNKGHYYTNQGGQATGFYTGNLTSSTVTIITGYNTGTPYVIHHPASGGDCISYTKDKNGNITGCAAYSPYVPAWDEYEQCNVYPLAVGAYASTSAYAYYSPSVQSQFGWINSNAVYSPSPVYASPAPTYFWPNRGAVPTWSTLGTGNALSPYFYQDPTVTAMSNSGSTNRNGSAQSPAWQVDRNDPTYNSRYLFVNPVSVTIPTGVAYNYAFPCFYSNGSTTAGTTTVSYYNNYGYLYENSNGSYVGAQGMWNFTFDGWKDGLVDTSWAWADNYQRVRYEQTFNGDYRNLGPRTTDGSGGLDGTLYGVEGFPTPAKPARASATIGSPVIGAANGDIFSAGGISSYFRSSSAPSAFIFTNSGSITNFLGANGYFPNYYINPDPGRVNSTTKPGNPDSIHQVFSSFDTEVVGKAQTIGSTMSGTFNLTSSTNKIYRVAGDLTMSATTFCGGPGTIYVEGNLTITGNTSYCAYNGTDRAQLPSVGIIVKGAVTVNPSVTSVVGSFFVNGNFNTGSVLDAAGNNRTTSDVPFSLSGLVVANAFNLQRQPSGVSNLSGVAAERFVYDGRVVVATPPAFNSLYTAPAVWNEAAPSN